MQKVKDRILQIRQKRRFPHVLAIIFSLLFIFWGFIPCFQTNFNGQINNVTLFQSFDWLSDSGSLLYYGVFLYLLGLILAGLVIIAGLIGIFGDDSYLNKTYYAGIAFFVIKAILDVVASILISQNGSNISLYVGGYLLTVFAVVLCVAYIWLYINWRDSSALLFKKEEAEEDEGVYEDRK